jgi:hypothetical protein
MKKIFYSSCAILGLVSLANCTKSSDVEIKDQAAELTASIVETKTSLNDLDVTWAKGDEIAIQLKDKHISNAINEKGNSGNYPATMGTYKLSDDAAGKKVGTFSFVSGGERIGDKDVFFAFYPAKYCAPQTSNGYFYMNFPSTQYYEDNNGGSLSLPMYGVGSGRNIEFKYAGAVIKLKLWASTETKVNSITISSDTGIPQGLFTYIQSDGNWTDPVDRISNSEVTSFTMQMRTPLAIGKKKEEATEVALVIPVSTAIKPANMKFSITCDLGGCSFKKNKPVTINPGDAISFSAKEVICSPSKMFIDGEEGEINVERITSATKKVSIVSADGGLISENLLKEIITKCESFKNLDHQIILDLSKAKAGFGVIRGYDDKDGFCGGRSDRSVKNISEFHLPEGITILGNMSLASSLYTKIVVPASLTSIDGFPSRYNDKMTWEVNANNKKFTAYEGALYSKDMTQLMVLNGGSGASHIVPEGTKSIRSWCMFDNSVITTLTLPRTLENLYSDSIDGTSNLSTIICLRETPATLEGQQVDTFKAKNKTIYVPGGAVEAYKAAWKSLVDNGWEVKTLEDAKNAGFTITTPSRESINF